MKRIIDHFLLTWKNQPKRKPLLLRGARQVGKTHAVRVLGKSFSNFVEINLEVNDAARAIIEKDLDIERIVHQLSELLQVEIKAGSTLLFLDEVQIVPKAIIALRYFYELLPDLHVVAAGSLLDFAIEQVGIPVGRVSTLYMYPLSFFEFLVATGNDTWANSLLNYDLKTGVSEQLHLKLLETLGTYLAIGGMPEAVNEWVLTKSSREVKRVHADLTYSYEQDFGKYAKKHQIKYLQILFIKALEQLSNKFVFSRVGEYQKRELSPALDLLEMTGLIYKVVRTAGQGVPLGAQADVNYFKVLFLDVGLAQSILKLNIVPWIVDSLSTFVNKGELVESFVGQEIIAYSDPIRKESLFYWSRDSRGSEAEVDFLIQLNDLVVPIEVKAGSSNRNKSMHIFLETHSRSKYGIRFWSGSGSYSESVHSYPLYCIFKPLIDQDTFLREAFSCLLTTNK